MPGGSGYNPGGPGTCASEERDEKHFLPQWKASRAEGYEARVLAVMAELTARASTNHNFCLIPSFFGARFVQMARPQGKKLCPSSVQLRSRWAVEVARSCWVEV